MARDNALHYALRCIQAALGDRDDVTVVLRRDNRLNVYSYLVTVRTPTRSETRHVMSVTDLELYSAHAQFLDRIAEMAIQRTLEAVYVLTEGDTT